MLLSENTYLINGYTWFSTFCPDNGFEPEKPCIQVIIEPYKLWNRIVFDVAELTFFQSGPCLSIIAHAESIVEDLFH